MDRPPDEQNRPTMSARERHEALVAKVASSAPAVAEEYMSARVEMLGCSDLMAKAFTSGEVDAVGYARAVRGCLVRVALRWARARKEFAKCLEG